MRVYRAINAGYVQQWNAAVERQIGKDASLTVAYAGSRGTHLLMQGWATVSNIGLNQIAGPVLRIGYWYRCGAVERGAPESICCVAAELADIPVGTDDYSWAIAKAVSPV